MNYGNQTDGLVHDIFVLNMANKQVQEKLCTEPKDNPADALQYAIAVEDGIKRQNSYGYINKETKIKEEPTCSKSSSSQNHRECWRCGAGNFTLDHKILNAMCNYCGRKSHLERACNQKKKDNSQQIGRLKATGNREQSGRRVQQVELDEEDEDDEDFMIVNVGRERRESRTVFYERLHKWKQVQGID